MKARCRVGDDPKLAADHPDWTQRDPAGRSRPALCLNNQYVAKILWPWMTQALADPACNGLEFEIAPAASAACWCEVCTQHLRDAGLDAQDPKGRADFARHSLDRFKDETKAYAEAVRPGASVLFKQA